MPKKIKTPQKNKTLKTAKRAPKKAPKKVQTPAVAPVQAPVAVSPAAPVKTDSEKIWDEIRHLPIEMFALPNQVVADHCTPIPQIDPVKLYMTVRSTATLPSLEATLNTFSNTTKDLVKKGHKVEVKEYRVELADRFVIVSRAPAPLQVPRHF